MNQFPKKHEFIFTKKHKHGFLLSIIRKIAESYKNNGTFLEWFNDYKNLKKNRK